MSKWKHFDFGEETLESTSTRKPQPKKIRNPKSNSKNNKLHNSSSSIKNTSSTSNSNVDIYKELTPKSIEDLVVPVKKLQEIEGWLESAFNNPNNRIGFKFLLLTGPTGSGKLSGLQLLCKSLNIDIIEWTNPVDIDFELLRGPGQTTKFLEFFSDSKYPSLFSTNTNSNNKKVVLVKDFPNAFIRSPEEFHNALETITYSSTHPIIFICTDSSRKEINLQRLLFAEEILLKYSISQICFNSCAATRLKKVIKKALDVLEKYPQLFKIPSNDTIEAIITSSMGDIRCAVNQLHLSSLINKENSSIPLTKPKIASNNKRKRTENSETIQQMIKDESLGLFHGLGRVLNPKRIEHGISWRLNCDVKKLVDEFSVQPSIFTAFLFENYIKYFGDINDIQKASDILSFTTGLMDSWDNYDILVTALWISVLGMMVFNEHRVSKWNQIRGPKKWEKNCDTSYLDPTDKFYYNIITKTNNYHKFNDV